ncbi:MAG TPA: carboxypeptidase-like regulatory domain-containing protein, partial [Kofleriaceae bacterium]|nr:carboxypeptidase-like regulatory domain-containing protein [Kofleriaceae bacterium]
MNRRTVGIGIAVALVLVVLVVLWKRRGGDEGPGRASESAAPSARLSSRIDVATVARGSIAGVVRDPAGAGIAGASVCGMAYSKDLPEDEQREPRCTETGEGGSYRLDELLPARYQVQAQADSFIPALYVDEGKRSWGFELAAGEAKEDIDLVLRPGGVEILGVVKDIGGGTVAGAWLFARAGRGWGDRGGLGTARSAADGTFRMWTAPGQVHVSAQADGYAEGSKDAVAPGQTIEILLTPESVLAGRVVEVNGGAPVPGALVTVGGWGVFGDGEGSSRETAMTDGDGKFRLTRLPPARYKPTAIAAGRYGQAAESVLLGLGETVEDIVIEVHAASMVRGRVVLADGKTPCTRGRVALEDR